MNNASYTTTFTVDQTRDEAFAAITNVRGWWSGEIDGHPVVAGAQDRRGDQMTPLSAHPDRELLRRQLHAGELAMVSHPKVPNDPEAPQGSLRGLDLAQDRTEMIGF